MDLAEKVAAIAELDEYEEEEVEYVEEEVEEEEEVEDEEEGDGIDSVDSDGEELEKQIANVGSTFSSSEPGKLFVGGVAWVTADESFFNYFKKYGKITDAVIMKDKRTQMPRGFGFVTFADPSIIDRLLEDEHVIDGRMVEVKRTVPRDVSSKCGPKTKKIFVGGIPTTFTEDELKEHFGLYGKVVDHQIMLNHSPGRSRGFGFVTFESEATVDKIISEGKMHKLGGRQVEIKKAEPKKAGGDATTNGRAGYGAGDANFYRFGSGVYEYGGGDYGSAGGYYDVGVGGSYCRGYGYCGPSYGSGFDPAFGGPMYGAGGYSAGNGYGALGGYIGGYGGYSGGRGYGYGDYSGGQGYVSRYHPYGR